MELGKVPQLVNYSIWPGFTSHYLQTSSNYNDVILHAPLVIVAFPTIEGNCMRDFCRGLQRSCHLGHPQRPVVAGVNPPCSVRLHATYVASDLSIYTNLRWRSIRQLHTLAYKPTSYLGLYTNSDLVLYTNSDLGLCTNFIPGAMHQLAMHQLPTWGYTPTS